MRIEKRQLAVLTAVVEVVYESNGWPNGYDYPCSVKLVNGTKITVPRSALTFSPKFSAEDE